MLFTSLVQFNMFNVGYFKCFVPLCLFLLRYPYVKKIDIVFHRALVAVGRGAFISSNFFIGIKIQQQTGVAKFFTSGFCYQKNNKQNFLETTDFPKFL